MKLDALPPIAIAYAAVLVVGLTCGFVAGSIRINRYHEQLVSFLLRENRTLATNLRALYLAEDYIYPEEEAEEDRPRKISLWSRARGLVAHVAAWYFRRPLPSVAPEDPPRPSAPTQSSQARQEAPATRETPIAVPVPDDGFVTVGRYRVPKEPLRFPETDPIGIPPITRPDLKIASRVPPPQEPMSAILQEHEDRLAKMRAETEQFLQRMAEIRT